jgi:hypothetical protein
VKKSHIAADFQKARLSPASGLDQLVQAMASFAPTGSALTASPFNQTTFDTMQQLSNHLAQPH